MIPRAGPGASSIKLSVRRLGARALRGPAGGRALGGHVGLQKCKPFGRRTRGPPSAGPARARQGHVVAACGPHGGGPGGRRAANAAECRRA